MLKKTTEEFIQQAIKIHGNRYNYDKVEYKTACKKVLIKCNVCNREFWQTPMKHLLGQGCRCNHKIGGLKLRSNVNSFIEKAQKIHGNKYDYSEVKYTTSYTKVKIFCKNCQEFFWQQPNDHLQGRGCKKCRDNHFSLQRRSSVSSFIKRAQKIHGNSYDYCGVNYINADIPVKIKCNNCNRIFYQTPQNHLKGKGCKYCNQSKNEKYIMKLLDSRKIEFITQKRFKECRHEKTLPFDFYLPKYNTCIEFQGQQHYYLDKFLFRYKDEETAKQAFKKQTLRDQIKRDFCKNNNIKLLEIRFDENIEEKLKRYFKEQFAFDF